MNRGDSTNVARVSGCCRYIDGRAAGVGTQSESTAGAMACGGGWPRIGLAPPQSPASRLRSVHSPIWPGEYRRCTCGLQRQIALSGTLHLAMSCGCSTRSATACRLGLRPSYSTSSIKESLPIVCRPSPQSEPPILGDLELGVLVFAEHRGWKVRQGASTEKDLASRRLSWHRPDKSRVPSQNKQHSPKSWSCSVHSRRRAEDQTVPNCCSSSTTSCRSS